MSCTSAQIAKAIGTSLLIAGFYLTSIALTFYNKWMSGKYRFPLTISLVHFIVIFLMAAFCRKVWELYKNEKRIVLEWDVFIRRIVPSAIAGSLDIGFSNWSIMLSTVSLYTMAKSSTILCVLAFSIFFGLEKPTWMLFVCVLFIGGGLFLFTYESEQFDLSGFLLALLASVMGGIRWTTAQMVMQKKDLGLGNPLDAIFHIQPMMAAVMVFLALILEGKVVVSSKLLFHAPSLSVALNSLLVIFGGAFLAFFLTMSEFLLVTKTSGITLSIAGIFKEICQLTIAAEVNHDKWGIMNFLGLVICMLGISIHVINGALKEQNVISSNEELGDRDFLLKEDKLESDGDDELHTDNLQILLSEEKM